MLGILEAEDVKAYYSIRQGYVKAVDGVNLSLGKGKCLGLAGESGCGKSTLMNALYGSAKPPLHLMNGSVRLDDNVISSMDKKHLKKNVWGVLESLVPQSALNALMPTERIIDFTIDVVKQHTNISDAEIVSMIKKRFDELNLMLEALYMYPHELSGGMKQRAVIAISTLLNPKLLIVDEPTSALDVSTQKQVLGTLMDLRRSEIVQSVIFVTHDIALLRQVADQIAIMYAGKMVELGSVDDILYRPRHPYTIGLVNAIYTPEPECRLRGVMSIPGEPPNLLEPPRGCRFHPRCSYAMDACRLNEPPLIKIKGERFVACHLNSLPQEGD